ncbi:MAG: AAA family ATPase [Bacteroidia bacterium]
MKGLTVEALLDRLTRAELLWIAREGRELGVVRPTYALRDYDAQGLRRLLRRHLPHLEWLPSVQKLLERYGHRSTREAAPPAKSTLPSISTLKAQLFPGVYGMEAEKEQLLEHFYLPLAAPAEAARYGIPSAPALLIEGAPGNGKSFLVRKFAQSTGFYYKVIHTPALASKWYGETERRLRALVQRALSRTPAILIFEEIEALFPDRERNLEWLNGATLQFALLLDEVKEKGGVGIIGVTNRAHRLDTALLRSERFDYRIYVNAPDKEERWILLTQMAQQLPFEKGINWEYWAEATAGWSRADIVHLLRQAGYRAFLRHYAEGKPQTISEEDLAVAFKSA